MHNSKTHLPRPQRLSEGLEYRDLVGVMKPTLHVDEFASKMGDDDDIVTLAFTIKGEQAGKDLSDWLERGYDYILDASNRFDFYHRVETRIPFDLDYFNRITNGGMPNKTLNVVLAGTGVGKSLFMCHVAASTLAQNRNVLYITMEMAEERIESIGKVKLPL